MNYIDTSFVALSLLGQEGASRAASIVNRLHREDGLISSVLFRVELLRLTHRTGTDPAKAQEIVDRVRLVDINDDVIERACAMTVELKSLDAIHLATALLLDDPGDPVTVFTHDARLAHALDRADRVGRDLRIAAADGDDRSRIRPMGTADDLTALAVSEARDGTRIDDVDVRRLVKRNNAIAALFEQPFHRLRLELIDLAAKCRKRCLQLPKSPFSY